MHGQARKFPPHLFPAGAVVPVVQCTLRDFDVVYAPHISSYGSVAATLEASPGTEVKARARGCPALPALLRRRSLLRPCALLHRQPPGCYPDPCASPAARRRRQRAHNFAPSITVNTLPLPRPPASPHPPLTPAASTHGPRCRWRCS